MVPDEHRRPAVASLPRRRDGIVVPLRVPLGTRLRAVTGLVLMIVLLGTIVAAVVAMVALAGAHAISNF